MTAVLPFTSFQPPGYSNASMACVKSAGLYCLHLPATCLSTALAKMLRSCQTDRALENFWDQVRCLFSTPAQMMLATGEVGMLFWAIYWGQKLFQAHLKSPPMYCDSGGLLLPPDKPSSSGCAIFTSSFCTHATSP